MKVRAGKIIKIVLAIVILLLILGKCYSKLSSMSDGRRYTNIITKGDRFRGSQLDFDTIMSSFYSTKSEVGSGYDGTTYIYKYFKTKDGKRVDIVIIPSSNKVVVNSGISSFDVDPKLHIRKVNDELDIFVTVRRGIICSTNPNRSTATVRVKFDRDQSKIWKVVGANDGIPNIMFFVESNRLLNLMRNSKIMSLELSLLGEGTRQVIFNLSGLRAMY